MMGLRGPCSRTTGNIKLKLPLIGPCVMAGWHLSKLHELTRTYKILYSITLCLLVISLLFRTFCVLLSLIIHVILTCGKKSQRSKRRKELFKVLTCNRSHDYKVNGSDTPSLLHSGFDFSFSVMHCVGLFRWLTLPMILMWTHTNIKLYSVLLCYIHLEYPQSVIHALEYSGVTLSTAAFSNSVGSWKAAATLTCTFK